MVRCDAGVEAQVQAVDKAASIAALEQFRVGGGTLGKSSLSLGRLHGEGVVQWVDSI